MNNPFKLSKNNRFDELEKSEKLEEIKKPDIYNKTCENIEIKPKPIHQEIKFINNRNTFSYRSNNEAPKKTYYEMNNQDFPELNSNENSENNDIKKNILDYKNASLKEVEKEENKTQNFEPGWLYMKYDKNNNILKRFVKSDANTTSNYSLNNEIKCAIDKIENRRLEYIKFYGEDNYERDYCVQEYEDILNSYFDDISEDEEYNEFYYEDGTYFE
jgi:hypothetical protein